MISMEFPQNPSLQSLIQQDGTEVFVLGPPGEGDQHTEPDENCRCMPQIWTYYDEDGKVGIIVVEHQYTQ